MQWFKHLKDFRNSAEIKYIEDELGDSGYARACKLLEIIATVAGKKKPFEARLVIEPPYTYRWLALELRCFYMPDDNGGNDKVPCEAEVVNTFRVFAEAGFISIDQEAEFSFRKYEHAGPVVKVETRPYQISVGGMKHWVEWHDVKNRN